MRRRLATVAATIVLAAHTAPAHAYAPIPRHWCAHRPAARFYPDQCAVPTGEQRVPHRGHHADVYQDLAHCESTHRNNGGAPHYGYFQFDVATWQSVGGTGRPDQHSYDEQRRRAVILHARRGWRPWPACSRKLGLR